jgi:protein ImuA
MSRADTQQALENVLRNPAIWRAEQIHARYPGIPTAFPALDQALPDAGWPVGVLTELLVNETSAGELSLLMPALHSVCAEERGIALLAPPCLPHARAWEAVGIPLERMLVVDSEGVDLLWAAEQILRSGECGAVLLWGQAAGRALNHRALQRLHLAAGAGNALCFLYRSSGVQEAPSPAPLRIRLAAHAGALNLHLVKCRGVMRGKPVLIELFPAHWQQSPVRVLSAASPIATTSHVKAADVQTTFTPTLVTAAPHEKANIKASSETLPELREREADEATAVAVHLHAIDVKASSASLITATSDLYEATADLLASSIAISSQCELAVSVVSRKTADGHVCSEPALVVAAPQWIAGGATIAPGSSSIPDTALFPAVHSRTSVA